MSTAVLFLESSCTNQHFDLKDHLLFTIDPRFTKSLLIRKLAIKGRVFFSLFNFHIHSSYLKHRCRFSLWSLRCRHQLIFSFFFCFPVFSIAKLKWFSSLPGQVTVPVKIKKSKCISRSRYRYIKGTKLYFS